MAAILAIETATKVCSTALSVDGAVLGETDLKLPQVHVERLVIMINELLKNLRMEYSDLDAVAVSNGPGSFTGLRIGLSVAKGICFARDKKLISVPTLDSIAMTARDIAEGKTIVPLLHARAEEFYYAAYTVAAGTVRLLRDYSIAESGAIADEFGPGTLFVGEGVGAFSANDSVSSKFGKGPMKPLEASAREVALIADGKFGRGEFSDLKSLAPLYVKDFVAIRGNPLSKLSRQTSGARTTSGMEKN